MHFIVHHALCGGTLHSMGAMHAPPLPSKAICLVMLHYACPLTLAHSADHTDILLCLSPYYDDDDNYYFYLILSICSLLYFTFK